MNNIATFNSINFHVATPDGAMFVNVMEDKEGKPFKIITSIGKCGTAVAAWAQAFDLVASETLENGGSVNKLIEILSGITSAGIRILPAGETVRSGPEGVCLALMRYRQSKFQELKNTLGLMSDFSRNNDNEDDDDDEDEYDLENRPARAFR